MKLVQFGYLGNFLGTSWELRGGGKRLKSDALHRILCSLVSNVIKVLSLIYIAFWVAISSNVEINF